MIYSYSASLYFATLNNIFLINYNFYFAILFTKCSHLTNVKVNNFIKSTYLIYIKFKIFNAFYLTRMYLHSKIHYVNKNSITVLNPKLCIP